MHSEAWAFLTDALREFQDKGTKQRVLEFGSRNVNGSCRDLLPGLWYHGVDIAPGDGVDEVCDAADFQTGTNLQYDIVICTEVFEHTPRWPEICKAALYALRPSGCFVLTAASDPRGEHSAVDGGGLRDGEYYDNIKPEVLEQVLKMVGFGTVVVQTHPRGDVYASVGIVIVVGTTIPAWKCNGKGELAWLENAEGMVRDAASIGEDLWFFAALEIDGRKYAPFKSLFSCLQEIVDYEVWNFRYGDRAEEIDSGNRLPRICMGRNMVHEYAMAQGMSHILFLDSDTKPPWNCVSKLLEIDHPVVGGHVPNYGMTGPQAQRTCTTCDGKGSLLDPTYSAVKDKLYLTPCASCGGTGEVLAYPDVDLQEHWNTAGFLLVRRDVFKVLRWRWSIDDGMTDDPCFQNDQQVWGFGQTWVRHDVIGQHVEPLIPVEQRDVDKKVYR